MALAAGKFYFATKFKSRPGELDSGDQRDGFDKSTGAIDAAVWHEQSIFPAELSVILSGDTHFYQSAIVFKKAKFRQWLI